MGRRKRKGVETGEEKGIEGGKEARGTDKGKRIEGEKKIGRRRMVETRERKEMSVKRFG